MPAVRLGALLGCLLALTAGCGADSGGPPGNGQAESRSDPAGAQPGDVETAPFVPPADAGSIRGHVELSGRPPGNRVIRMGMDPKCDQLNQGELVVQESVVANQDGDLGNVFVYLQGDLPDFLPPPDPVRLDQQDCVYIPRVVGAQVGQLIEIRNSDELAHNLHAFSEADNGFNVGQPRAGLVYRFRPEAPEIMLHLACDLHRWMTSYIGILEHPYFAVTSTDGSFVIDGVPAGTYTIHAWHELFGELSGEVQVDSGQTAEFEFSYDGGDSGP